MQNSRPVEDHDDSAVLPRRSTAVLSDKLEDAFRHRYPGFRSTSRCRTESGAQSGFVPGRSSGRPIALAGTVACAALTSMLTLQALLFGYSSYWRLVHASNWR
jgi:hypothetical protein